MVRFFFAFLALFVSALLLTIFIKTAVRSRKLKADFVTFLKASGDIETLYRIGVTNKYGLYEPRRVLAFQVLSWLAGKYKETNKDEYLAYEEKFRVHLKVLPLCWFGFFIFLCVFLIVIEN